jgi:hypothetical protein
LYCPEGHCTFTLLPDCFAARRSGTLAEVEAVVRAAEQAPSRAALCDTLRPEVELPGVLRLVRRRVQDVHGALTALKGLLGSPFLRVEPTVAAFAAHLEVAMVLVVLRGIAAPWSGALPAPLGFAPRTPPVRPAPPRSQHRAGPDPPGS